MKTMKRISAILMIALTLVYSGCEPDDPNDPDVDNRDRYVGTWMAEESSSQFPTMTFTVKIEKDPANEDQVLISNFYHLGNAPGDRVKAIVSYSTISIPQQTVCDLLVNGDGNLSGNKISWTYYVNDGAEIDNVTAVYTKI